MIHARIEEESKVAGGEGKGVKGYFVGCIREMKVPSIRHRFALVLGMMFLQNFSGAITISKPNFNSLFPTLMILLLSIFSLSASTLS